VGSFCICLATVAQSPNSESIPMRCFLFASIPHAISAFVKVVKWLRTALRPTGVIVFISVRVGTRPSFCANPWISVIISSLLIAFSPVKAFVGLGFVAQAGPRASPILACMGRGTPACDGSCSTSWADLKNWASGQRFSLWRMADYG
jgi:hypothetical protein